MTKEEVIEFAKQFYEDIHRTSSNIASAEFTRINKDNIDDYVKNYYKYKTKSYINKLNALLDRFERVLGRKFDESRYCNREWEFKRWTGYHDELLIHIKKLEKQKIAEDKKKLERELKIQEARIKKLERELKMKKTRF